MSLCRACSRPVVFARDQDGKWQVLDPIAPVYRVSRDPAGKAACVRDTKALVSHWVTCQKRDDIKAWQEAKKAPPEPEQHFSEPKDPTNET